MTEERLAEIESKTGYYVSVKELIAEVRRCWALIAAIVIDWGPPTPDQLEYAEKLTREGR